MATDKSLNVRQVRAAEDMSAALTEINAKIDALTAEILALKELLTQPTGPADKFQAASRKVGTRDK